MQETGIGADVADGAVANMVIDFSIAMILSRAANKAASSQWGQTLTGKDKKATKPVIFPDSFA